MPYRPVSRSRTAVSFAPPEWDLLVRLPGRVLVAATSAGPDGARPTVAEGLAGIEAIAAGRTSASPLVRDVVAAIYAERWVDGDTANDLVDLAGVLAECRAVSHLLADRVPSSDAAAYRGWLLAIAATVCAAGRQAELFGLDDGPASDAERRFLDELTLALSR